MGQSYFQFKEFLINQDKTAMKVTTESCLFGAYISKENQLQEKDPFISLLDIGAGTGLLSLMFIQKNPKTRIQAIEIDLNAANQCDENFQNSSWKENLFLVRSSIQDYEKTQAEKFDLIISNPPFHENQLKGRNESKSLAHHSTELTLKELFKISSKMIKRDGQFWILIPYYRGIEIQSLALESGFYLRKWIQIKSNPHQSPFRLILGFHFQNPETQVFKDQIQIREEDGRYSPVYLELMEDYYL